MSFCEVIFSVNTGEHRLPRFENFKKALNPFILLTGILMICYPERMSHLSKKGKEKEDSFDSKEKDYDLSDNNDETDDDVFISDLDHRRQQARLIIKKNQIRKKN